MNDEPVFKRMQVKVLYSFNDSSTVFMSRSAAQHQVKVVDIPMWNADNLEEQIVLLGAFDLKACLQQLVHSSPENFRLASEDYAVYYKDITEQPEEPYVANGELTKLLDSDDVYLIPGRVCQNYSAKALFGNNSAASSHTLEIRLKLHTIAGQPQIQLQLQLQTLSAQQTTSSQVSKPLSSASSTPAAITPVANDASFASVKRPAVDQQSQYVVPKRPRVPNNQPPPPVRTSASMNSAVKATRTKSLPIFYNPHNLSIFNIIAADKMNTQPKYDSKNIQDRFKLAPFLRDKVVDSTGFVGSRLKTTDQPQRAMRTRSMLNQRVVDDSRVKPHRIEEEEEEELNETNFPDEDDEDDADYVEEGKDEDDYDRNTNNTTFQSLPDLDDLDSKKTHTLPNNKLPYDHGLICVNNNCATNDSIAWRYFETGYHPNYHQIHNATEFSKEYFDGMFGPLCNACYLFLRNKGFMRPLSVVKKYLQQQRYKREVKQKEEYAERQRITNSRKQQSNNNSSGKLSSSSPHKFATPLHTPSAINQVIQNNSKNSRANIATAASDARLTPNYNDLNDFMNQLNSFGGPLTDIDMPNQDTGVTPPMIATKSNTRVINLFEAGDRKSSVSGNNEETFDQIIQKSLHESESSPNNEWIGNLFEKTPRDQTPGDTNNRTPLDDIDTKDAKLDLTGTHTLDLSDDRNEAVSKIANMPSSPLMGQRNGDLFSGLHADINTLVESNQLLFNSSSPNKAVRHDTTMSWSHYNDGKSLNRKLGSTPTADFYDQEDNIKHRYTSGTNKNLFEQQTE